MLTPIEPLEARHRGVERSEDFDVTDTDRALARFAELSGEPHVS